MKKNIAIEESTARELYKTATSELKVMLEESFGKDFFKQKITDRIKTVGDVLAAIAAKGRMIVLPFTNPQSKFEKYVNASVLIPLISEVLNEGWVEDWRNHNQYKYYPWFEKLSSGWAFGGVCDGYRYACAGFGHYYKDDVTAKYAGVQFGEVY